MERGKMVAAGCSSITFNQRETSDDGVRNVTYNGNQRLPIRGEKSVLLSRAATVESATDHFKYLS